ncbi:MAG: hypothetical protein HYX99_03835 [Chloroflexi bacterium]|nr:hypothetical protein [Chloroflexota bacterium]
MPKASLTLTYTSPIEGEGDTTPIFRVMTLRSAMFWIMTENGALWGF